MLLLLVALAGCVACKSKTAAPSAEPAKEPTPAVMRDVAAPAVMPPKLLTLAPAKGKPTMLFVLLHGVGADAASFHDLAQALAIGAPQAEFLTPDGFHPFDGGGTGRQWFSLSGMNERNGAARVREAGAELSTWMDYELARRGLGPDKLVIAGFSQGAMMTAWLAVHRRPAPAAAVMFSGRVIDDGAAVAGSVSTPVWMAHGERDQRIAVATQAPGAAVLRAWGANVTTKIYPNLAHSIDRVEVLDAAEFLLKTLPH